jgi:hypothetical protein
MLSYKQTVQKLSWKGKFPFRELMKDMKSISILTPIFSVLICTCKKVRILYKIFVREREERDYFGDLGMFVRIKLKWHLKRYI